MKSYSKKHGNLMHHAEIDRLMRELYAARQRRDLDAVCQSFSNDASFQIETASRAKRVAIEAVAFGEIRSLLALLIKMFKLAELALPTTTIDGSQASIYWRADVHSRIT